MYHKKSNKKGQGVVICLMLLLVVLTLGYITYATFSRIKISEQQVADTRIEEINKQNEEVAKKEISKPIENPKESSVKAETKKEPEHSKKHLSADVSKSTIIIASGTIIFLGVNLFIIRKKEKALDKEILKSFTLTEMK